MPAPDGALDLARGDNGVRVHGIDHAHYSALTPLPSGGFIAGGASAAGSLLAAATPDGALDPAFGAAGGMEDDLFDPDGQEDILALAARPDLRCVALVQRELGRHTSLVRFWR